MKNRCASHPPSDKWELLPDSELGVIVNDNDEYFVRRLTPLEYERLQGFPDNWTLNGQFPTGKKQMSMSRRYRLLGNAVTTPVIAAIGDAILAEIET